MATQSVQKSIGGPYWPLGMIVVPTPGTPVRITSRVDPSNNNAPETSNAPGSAAANNAQAYAPTVHKIFFQGYHPNANNNGLIPNTGNIYLLVAGAQGSGNKSDYGSMIMVIGPGGGGTWPAAELEADTVNPYALYVDADSANDGVLCVGQI